MRKAFTRNFPGRASDSGAQLLELALVLPVLLFLVVGAWDIGSAIILKQKLTNAVREGARYVVSNSLRPSPTCSSTDPPCAVTDAENVVVQYLSDAGVDASCISSSTPSSVGTSAWKWSCKGTATSLTINAAYLPPSGYLSTQVTITYPVQWITGNFMGLGPSGSTVTTSATMMNWASGVP